MQNTQNKMLVEIEVRPNSHNNAIDIRMYLNSIGATNTSLYEITINEYKNKHYDIEKILYTDNMHDHNGHDDVTNDYNDSLESFLDKIFNNFVKINECEINLLFSRVYDVFINDLLSSINKTCPQTSPNIKYNKIEIRDCVVHSSSSGWFLNNINAEQLIINIHQHKQNTSKTNVGNSKSELMLDNCTIKNFEIKNLKRFELGITKSNVENLSCYNLDIQTLQIHNSELHALSIIGSAIEDIKIIIVKGMKEFSLSNSIVGALDFTGIKAINDFELKNFKIFKLDIVNSSVERLSCSNLDIQLLWIYNNKLNTLSIAQSIINHITINNVKDMKEFSLLNSVVGALDFINTKVINDMELIDVKFWSYIDFAGSRFIKEDGGNVLYVSNISFIKPIDIGTQINNLNKPYTAVNVNTKQYFNNIKNSLIAQKVNSTAFSQDIATSIFNSFQQIRDVVKQTDPILNNNLRDVQTRIKQVMVNQELNLHKKTSINFNQVYTKFKKLAKQYIKTISVAINGLIYVYEAKNKKALIINYGKSLLNNAIGLFTNLSLTETKLALWFNIATGGGVFYLTPTILFLLSFALFKYFFNLDIILPFQVFAGSSKNVDIGLLDIIANTWLYFLAWQAIKAFSKAKGVK